MRLITMLTDDVSNESYSTPFHITILDMAFQRFSFYKWKYLRLVLLTEISRIDDFNQTFHKQIRQIFISW